MNQSTVQRVVFALLVLASAAALIAGASDRQEKSGGQNPAIDQVLVQSLEERDLKPSGVNDFDGARRRLFLNFTAAPGTQPAAPLTLRGTFVVDQNLTDFRKLEVLGLPTTQPADLSVSLNLDPNVWRQIEAVRLEPTLNDNAALGWGQSPSATYLGVGVESPTETLRAQLKLPQGAGLVVNYVDENGPSKALVRKHDVLQKLDDQILINAEQLVTLVRMHKPDDSVSLTLIREASPVTVQVKLGQKQDGNQPLNIELRSAVDKDLSDVYTSSVAGTNSVPVLSKLPYIGRLYDDADTRPITFNDGEVLATLDGHGHLLAVQVKTGKVLFHGSVATQDQWKAVPEFIREKLSSWRQIIAPGSGDAGATKGTNGDASEEK